MAKRNSNKTTTTKGASDKRSNPLLSAFALIFGVTLLSLPLAGVYLGLLRETASNTTQLEQLSEAIATQQSFAIQTAVNQYQAQLAQLATNPALLLLLSNQDTTSLDTLSQEYGFNYPNLASLRFIPLGPLGIAGLGKNNISLRNNIEVDMVRKASQNKPVPVELYSYNDKWLISFAAGVANPEGIVVGAILLTVNDEFLKTALRPLDLKSGQTLIQIGGNQPRTVVQSAGKGIKKGTATVNLPYQGWQLIFMPSAQLVQSTQQDALPVWITFAALALLICGMTLLGYRQLSQALSQNFDRLIQYSRDLISKSKANKPDFSMLRFPEAAQCMSTLRKMSAPTEDASKKSAVTTQAQKSAGRTGLGDSLFDDDQLPDLDDLTDFDDVLDLDDGLDISGAEVPVLHDNIFRAYDIRGLVGSEIDDSTCYHLGLAIGSEAADQQQRSIVVACDGRHSSPSIKDALIKGLLDAGLEVIDIGLAPTPVLYFATFHLETHTGVMVTGSHNPPEYNGFKIVIDDHTLTQEAIQKLKLRIQTQNYHRGQGHLRQESVDDDYIDTIISDVAIAQPLKVVIDAGNGSAGKLAPRLIEELGCEVVQLYCDIDGNFPNHHPDPSKLDNLQDLISAVRDHQADLGIAFDGDADRLGVVTGNGNVILPDRLLMLFAQDVVSRNPGTDVIFDVKSTRHLNTLISSYGGRPIMWKSGHSYIKEKMQETGALLGGELSGHIFFKERWFGFDDGIYSAARLIEILSMSDPDLDNQLSVFPTSIATPELHVPINEEAKFPFIEKLIRKANFQDAKITDLDGLRVDFPDGWGLVRASNTTPVLTLRFEAESDDALQRIQQQFRELLLDVDDTLILPY